MANTFVIKSTVLGHAIRKDMKVLRVMRFGTRIEYLPVDEVILVDRIIDSSQREVEDQFGLLHKVSKDSWTKASPQVVTSYQGGQTHRVNIPVCEIMVISYGCPAVAARWAVRFL